MIPIMLMTAMKATTLNQTVQCSSKCNAVILKLLLQLKTFAVRDVCSLYGSI